MMARMLVLVILLAATPFASAQEPIFGPVGFNDPNPPHFLSVPAPTTPPTQLTTRTYAVADLVVPIQGLDYPHGADRSKEETKTKEAWLMDKITTIVAANSWQQMGGPGTIEYRAPVYSLVVTQTPQVQAQVADLLATMERVQNVEITVESRLIAVSNRRFAKLRRAFSPVEPNGVIFLNSGQALDFLNQALDGNRDNETTIPRITMASGQNCQYGLEDILEAKISANVAANLRHIRMDVKADALEGKVHFKKVVALLEGTTVVMSAKIDAQAHLLYIVTPRLLINLDSAVVAPVPPPPNRVIQASAVAGITPPLSGPVSGITTLGTPAKKTTEKQVTFRVCVSEGDPLGSREANTVRTLVDTTIVTLENQTCMLHSGGLIPARGGNPVPLTRANAAKVHAESIPFGTIIQAIPTNVEDGNLRLDLTVSLAKRQGDQTKDRVQLLTESTRTIRTVALGEVVRLRLGKKTDEIQRWVEITATQVNGAD